MALEDARTVVIDRVGLQALLEVLGTRGYTVIAPTVRDGAIVYDEIDSIDDLPAGVTDVQEPGSYRLSERDDAALFGYAVGPHSWKKYLFRPETVLFRARLDPDRGFVPTERGDEVAPRYAFLGVRACEVAAIEVQDRVFLRGSHRDRDYGDRRDGAFVIAVQCGEPGGVCFCVSMHTGPRTDTGFDLALTELVDAERHEFLVEVGSERGEEVLADVPSRAVRAADVNAAQAVTDRAASRMGRTLEAEGLPQRLAEVLEHPQWDDVATRCLACTNCTLVCPTCFCSSVEDTTDLAGAEATRTRKWDSCFTLDHSYIHGGSIRASTRDRYRQWLTHKLSTWVDQFGTSGCVGCGRCITWCPVGIDLTAEVRALLEPT